MTAGSVTVRLPGVVASWTDGASAVTMPAGTVQTVLEQLVSQHPQLGGRVMDEDGTVPRWINVFIDGADVRTLDGLATPVSPGAVMTVVPAVAGG